MPTNDTRLHLLVVDEVEDDAALVVSALECSGYVVSHRRVDTAEALRAAFEEQDWDLLTSEHAMPRFCAPRAVATAPSLRLGTPAPALKLWEGLYHEIHNEPEKAEVLADMIAWLDQHLA